MKANFLKTNFSAFALLLFLLAALASCKKDKEPALTENLAGEWKVTSFQIDGLEFMDLIITSSNLEFEDMSGAEGDFEWNFSYIDTTFQRFTGTYTVDEKDKEIEMEYPDGTTEKYEFDLSGDQLELVGRTSSGGNMVVKTERD